MKTPKPILERRRSVRISESLPFKIGHESYECTARTINISEYGALVVVDKSIPVMTMMALALTLPGKSAASKGKTIRMKGVVVRRDADEAGGKFLIAVFFSEIDSKDRRTLQQFIESRAPRQP